MASRSRIGLGILFGLFLMGCQAQSVALERPSPGGTRTHAFNDVAFTSSSCEITADRSAVCRFQIDNRFRDKKIGVDRRITIQDDAGNDYPVTTGGFGDLSARPQWFQVAVADSSYELVVIATNLSTRARAIRAIVFTRLGVLTPQGQTIGYRDGVIFSNPRMIGSTPAAAPVTVAETPAPSAYAGDRWHWIGYWNYDGIDGNHLAEGLVLRDVRGSGMGQSWQAHLELTNHDSLRRRTRTLWPVAIHTGLRRVCANYPGYPTYQAFVDMPGTAEDGVYGFSECAGFE